MHTQLDPAQVFDRDPKIAEGRAYCDEYVAQHGMDAAEALHHEKMPRGVSWAGTLEEWRYWNAFWQRLKEMRNPPSPVVASDPSDYMEPLDGTVTTQDTGGGTVPTTPK